MNGPAPPGVRIPHERLDPETLHRLLEEYVTRDGTDYGGVEASIERKIDDVLRLLRQGKAVIVWDEESGTTNVVLRRDLPPDAR